MQHVNRLSDGRWRKRRSQQEEKQRTTGRLLIWIHWVISHLYAILQLLPFCLHLTNLKDAAEASSCLPLSKTFSRCFGCWPVQSELAPEGSCCSTRCILPVATQLSAFRPGLLFLGEDKKKFEDSSHLRLRACQAYTVCAAVSYPIIPSSSIPRIFF